MRRFATLAVVAAAILVVLSVLVVKMKDNQACGSVTVGDAKPVGTITFRPGAQEVAVWGNLSIAPLTTEGVDHWRIRSTQGEGVEIKVFPLTAGGQTLFQNIGLSKITLRDAQDKSCAYSINPKARRGYIGIGSLEVYLAQDA